MDIIEKINRKTSRDKEVEIYNHIKGIREWMDDLESSCDNRNVKLSKEIISNVSKQVNMLKKEINKMEKN